MSDFLSQQQCDELVNGQTYNGEYQPTEQDYINMNEAWNHDKFCQNCDTELGNMKSMYNTQSPDARLCSDCYQYKNNYMRKVREAKSRKFRRL